MTFSEFPRQIPPDRHPFTAERRGVCTCGFPPDHHFHVGVTNCTCDLCTPLPSLEFSRPRVAAWFRRRVLGER